MHLDKPTRKRLLAHCGELHDDDAVDPRDFFKPAGSRHKPSRKTLQLCSQVAETLALLWGGELDDEALQELTVESVVPAPDASQLAVTLRAKRPLDAAEAQQLLERVQNAAGRLRCEVAAAITRKRAPKLLFHVAGAAHD